MNEASSGAGAAAYRGFLFSDVRGFTAYAERHGNSAAAAMVSRFLELARAEIARYDGAEIKTEGDNVFAVFPSASSAVMCGLEIVDAAAAANAKEPDRPLDLGVGVHAGEAVETAEGYIGSAVNLAARLCAAAQPGEVLVSADVKGMTQASIPVGFIARGRRRLKGFSNAVETFAVTRDTTARTAVVLPRIGALLGIAGVLAVAAVVIMVFGAMLGSGATATASATPGPTVPGPTTQPVAMGKLDIGTYATTAFATPFTFHIGDLGWTANRDAPSLFGLLHEDAPRGSLVVARVDEVITMPCTQGDIGSTAPVPTDVIEDLRKLDHFEVSDAAPLKVAGVDAREVDVTISEAALAACGGVAGADVSVFRAGDEVWGGAPGERFRLITFAIGAQPITVIVSLDWTETHSVQELEDMLDLGENVVDSLAFAGAGASSPPAP